jgi:cellobiose phosphorylase
MAGLGKEEGADIKTMNSVDKYLNSEHGLVLNNPAFTRYYIQYGEISTYPPGYKENAPACREEISACTARNPTCMPR